MEATEWSSGAEAGKKLMMEGKRVRGEDELWASNDGWLAKRPKGAPAGQIEDPVQDQDSGESRSQDVSNRNTPNEQKSQTAENVDSLMDSGENPDSDEEEYSDEGTLNEEYQYSVEENPENDDSVEGDVMDEHLLSGAIVETLGEDSEEIDDSYDFRADNAYIRNSDAEIAEPGDNDEQNGENEHAHEDIFYSAKNDIKAEAGVERKRARWDLDAPPFLFKSAKQVFNTQQEELIKNTEPQSSKKQIKKEIDDRWHYLDTIALNRADDMWKATVDEYETLYDRYKQAYPEVVLKPPPSRLAQIPKKPQNAFQLFYGDMCALSKESGKKFGLVQAQKEWKALSEDEKFPYTEAHKKLEQEYKKQQHEMPPKTQEAVAEHKRFNLASKPKSSNSALKRISSDPCEFWIQQKTREYKQRKLVEKSGQRIKVQMKNHWDNLDEDTQNEWVQHHAEILAEQERAQQRPDIIWSFNVGDGLFGIFGKKESSRLCLDLAKFIHGTGPAVVETKHQSKKYHVHLASMVMRRANGKATAKEIPLRMQVVDRGVGGMMK